MSLHGKTHIAEALYFFLLEAKDTVHAVAMLARYNRPDKYLSEASYGVLTTCRALGDLGLILVDVTALQSVVAMVPLPMSPQEVAESNTLESHAHYDNRFFLVEMPGLEVTNLGDSYSDGMGFMDM